MNEVVLQPLGPILWQDAAYGMTVGEVRSAFSGAVLNDRPGTLNDGAICTIKIPNLDIASHDFSVLFYFRSDRLTQVTLTSNGGANLSVFRSISVALRAKYGPELAYQESDYSFSTADWISSNGVNISVVLHEGVGLLNIVFQTRLISDASKL